MQENKGAGTAVLQGAEFPRRTEKRMSREVGSRLNDGVSHRRQEGKQKG